MNDIQSVNAKTEEAILDDTQLREAVQLALLEAAKKGASATEAPPT